jgi:acyl-CoA reductase-like NAD-dependent aldehyde dehydrogenase
MGNALDAASDEQLDPTNPNPTSSNPSIEGADSWRVTALEELAITTLSSRKQAWIQLGLEERIAYLHHCIDGVMTVGDAWAEAACRAKGIDPHSSLAGEEWIAGPVATLLNLRQLVTALEAKGQPKPIAASHRENGQAIAQVFPDHWMDRLLWLGFKAEVWLEPGKPMTQGALYREPPQTGKVALVLGAGNISSISAMDTLYKLFLEGEVVLLKMNPVNKYIGPFLAQAFESLRQDGFFAVVYGGAEVGSALCQHPDVDTIHVTGSHHTHDAIVWGRTPAEQQQRKAAQQPLLTKPITSELGCVTPVLVVPGCWSRADLKFQARHVASMVAHNASFNCVAAKVIVTAKGWPQRAEFLEYLHQALANTPAREAYYPGAQDRYQAFLDRYPQAKILGDRSPQVIPWTVIPEVNPAVGEYALTEEAFCGILAEVSFEATHAPDFLVKAVAFANETLWGSLSCVLLVDPATQRNCREALEGAIANLRYGGIGVNVWTGAVFMLGVTTWGAFPGNSLSNIGSGRGVVHNTYLFDHPQKSVLRAPFRIWPTPIWFSDHRNLKQLAQKFAALQAKSTLKNFANVLLAALKS